MSFPKVGVGGKERMAVMDFTDDPHCPNLESGLVCDLLWPIECGRRDVVLVLSSSQERSCIPCPLLLGCLYLLSCGDVQASFLDDERACVAKMSHAG